MKKIFVVFSLIICTFAVSTQAQWYEGELDALKEKSFVASEHFQNPDNAVLREEICNILMSLYKYQNPDVVIEEKSNSFFDISDSPYKESIEEAYSLGLINGISESAFGGKDTLTREQFAAIIYRMHGSQITVTRKYEDFSSISEYALEAIDYCISKGIVKGTSKGYFSPKDTLTKAQALVIVSRIADMPKDKIYSEAAAFPKSVFEDSEYAYIVSNKENELVVLNKKTDTRKVISFDSVISSTIIDIGDSILVPKAFINSQGNPKHEDYQGGYIVNKKTYEITEFSSPWLLEPLAYYKDCIYYLDSTTEKYKYHLAKYNIRTGKTTISNCTMTSSYKFEYTDKNMLYLSGSSAEEVNKKILSYGIVYQIDLENLSVSEETHKYINALDAVTSKYYSYNKIENDKNHEIEANNRSIVLCNRFTNEIIKEIKAEDIFFEAGFNNAVVSPENKRDYLNYRACNIDDEIYILSEARSRLICISNDDMFDVDIDNFHLNHGEELLEVFSNNSGVKYALIDILFPREQAYKINDTSSGAAYSSVYNRRIFYGADPLPENARTGLEVLNFKKTFADNHKNPADLIYALNYYLTHECNYDYDSHNNPSSPIFSINDSTVCIVLHKKAVCSGYANAFNDVLRYAGVKCSIIEGQAHAWNVVELNGNKYYFDTTWNSGGKNENSYYMMSLEEISRDHTPYDRYLGYLY